MNLIRKPPRTVLCKVTKPNKAEAAVLKRLFPSASPLPQPNLSIFSPVNKCVFEGQKVKRKQLM